MSRATISLKFIMSRLLEKRKKKKKNKAKDNRPKRLQTDVKKTFTRFTPYRPAND